MTQLSGAEVEKMREFHTPFQVGNVGPDTTRCINCNTPWPCDAFRLLDALDVERRAPVQRSGVIEAGSIPWWVHELAYEDYARPYGTDQSAARIAERGGFSWGELGVHLAAALERRGCPEDSS